MTEPTDRRPQMPPPPAPEDPAVVMIRANDETPLAALSPVEAALYIGDMAASLRRIAAGCDLGELVRRLDGVVSEARAAARQDGTQRSRGAR